MSFGFSWVIILTHIQILRLKTVEKTMATSATSQSHSVLSTKIIIDMHGTIEWRITHPLSMRCKLQICVKIVTTTPSVMAHHHQLNTISMNGRLTNAPLFSFSYCYFEEKSTQIRIVFIWSRFGQNVLHGHFIQFHGKTTTLNLIRIVRISIAVIIT